MKLQLKGHGGWDWKQGNLGVGRPFVLYSRISIGYYYRLENNRKCVPETITFYNKTKFGVDVADQMACKYSVEAGYFRWPLQVFLLYFRVDSDKRVDIVQRVYWIENIQKGDYFFVCRWISWRKQGEHSSFRRFRSSDLQHQECEKVAKWATVINIEALIAVCIVKISYAENAQKIFNTYVKTSSINMIM